MRITRPSSDLIDDRQEVTAVYIIERYYDTSAPGFRLSGVSLHMMDGLTRDERQVVSEFLVRNTSYSFEDVKARLGIS